MKKLKQKWGVESNFQFLIIFIVFGITGSLSVRLSGPILNLINVIPESFPNHFWGQTLYWILRILIVFPVYQLILVVVGALFLQGKFFWNFEKKMLRKMGFGFLFKQDD
ncbi:MAG: DUF6787 family protein [Flavobacteriaceae bacterium]